MQPWCFVPTDLLCSSPHPLAISYACSLGKIKLSLYSSQRLTPMMVSIHRRLKSLAGVALTLIIVFLLWHRMAVTMKSVGANTNTSMKSVSPNAYVFYATQDVYACSVLVNIHRLRQMYHTKHRILVFVSSGVSNEYLTRFTDLDAKVILETPPPLSTGSSPYYKDCLLKLVPFRVHELDEKIQRCLILESGL